jgi:hypothetical protein
MATIIAAAVIVSTLSGPAGHAMPTVIGHMSDVSTNGFETKTGTYSIAFQSQSSVSATGSVLIAGSGGSLVTSAGTWTFNSVQGNGGYEILLNRASARGGYADSLYVENGGQMYAQNSANNWYLWASGGWSATTSPLSPDGSVLNAGSGGNLITKYGIWTFSSSSSTGGYEILLQGSSTGSAANSLYVENGGQVYALNSMGDWYLWSGGSWSASAEPSALNSASSFTASNEPSTHIRVSLRLAPQYKPTRAKPGAMLIS